MTGHITFMAADELRDALAARQRALATPRSAPGRLATVTDFPDHRRNAA